MSKPEQYKVVTVENRADFPIRIHLKDGTDPEKGLAPEWSHFAVLEFDDEATAYEDDNGNATKGPGTEKEIPLVVWERYMKDPSCRATSRTTRSR